MTEADVHATLTEHLIQHLRHTHADAGEVRVVHTHISTVLLAGDFAYKLKRPVRLPFLDFSTLERRQHFLQEELRLNQRTAPELYLDLLPVTGRPDAPRLGGSGPIIDWALRMRRFGPGGDFRAMAEAGTVAVLLPGAFHVMRETQLPPIELLRQYGVPMAVASDANPGTSPICMPTLMANLACTLFRLTPREALSGMTAHGARALGLPELGRIVVGAPADLCLWDIQQPAELAYAVQAGLAPDLLNS